MTKCWCYQCNKRVIATDDLKCPYCHDDYIEIEEDQTLPVDPIETQSEAINPPRNNQPFPFNLFPINNIVLPTPLNNIIQNVFNRIPIFGNFQANQTNGLQLNDFFLGNEEQFQELAERLFRMNQQSMGSPPADSQFINELKTQPYKLGDSPEDVCSICLESFEEGTEVILLPCKHGFHLDCISPWLKLHSECPSCRHKLPAKQ